MQLGPVVLSRIAIQCGTSESYLERIMNRFPYVKDPDGFPASLGYDPRLVTKLVYNYRTLPDILEVYNSLFYDGELLSTVSAFLSSIFWVHIPNSRLARSVKHFSV